MNVELKRTGVYEYERVDVDPVTFQVIHHRLNSIIDEQGATLSAVSGSPLVNEATDYNTGIFRANGELVAMGKTVLLHAASVATMVKHIIADCEVSPGITSGDMFLVNNPYKGSLHAPDMGLVAPVFHDNQRIGWVGVCCHQLDVGGMAPGGSFPEAVDVRQEGVLIPPLKVVENGAFRTDIIEMITGMSRLPANMNLDFRGMLAANTVALKRIAETVEKYGVDTVLSVMDESIDKTEQEVRKRLGGMPDGVFRSQTFLDHDGASNRLYRIKVEMTKQGDSLTFDFTDSDGQSPRFINCTEGGLLAGVRAAVLPILAHDLPWNEGVFRPVSIKSREGSVVSARFPAPVSQGPLGAMWLVETVATNALSKLASTTDTYMTEAQASPNGGPDHLGLHGLNQHGEFFHSSILDMIYVGGGAYVHRDGLSPQGHRHMPAVRLQNVESNEQVAPILYLYRKMVPDTGGAGRNRGGTSLGTGYVLHGVDHMELRMACHGYESPTAFGIFGGMPGACNMRRFRRGAGAAAIIDGGAIPRETAALGGEILTLPAKMIAPEVFTADDIYEMSPSAGAGWGDPLDREPSQVLADVLGGDVSAHAAASIYGVIVTGKALDMPATTEARAAIRQKRAGWPVAQSLADAPDPAGAWETIAPVGDKASIARQNGTAYFRCGCGSAIAPAARNWKTYARRGDASAPDLGPRIKLHADLDAAFYACPSCARIHAVEFGLKGEEPLWDIELKL